MVQYCFKHDKTVATWWILVYIWILGTKEYKIEELREFTPFVTLQLC